MHGLGWGLQRLGRHGPVLLVASLAVGAAAPALARAAHGILPLSAFLLTLGSFLTAALAPPQADLGWRRLAAALAWVGLGVPALVAFLVAGRGLDPTLEAGVLLSVMAPPVGSAAAIAAMLGLQPRLALAASIVLTLAAPALMPAFAAGLGLDVAVDMGRLAGRLVLIVGTAALIAEIVRRHRSRTAAVLPDGQAAAGVAVLGLVVVGLAMADGVRAHWTADPGTFGLFLAAAVAINLGAGLAGALLFAGWGAQAALTVGLVSGNRNVTLAWAAAGATLPPLAEGYVAACVLPVLALPLAVKAALALRAWLGERVPPWRGRARVRP